MSKWVNMSEVNNTLGKALESCKDELNPSFYGGARLMLDKINEMAEEVADTPQPDTEIAKAIVHKMIDDAVIAEDAYPDLRQKMHDAVDEYEPQTDCPWK